MRRIHLFEVEDLDGCPLWLRRTITDMLSQVHQWFDTAALIERELRPLLSKSRPNTVIDLCSGSGGPMPEVIRRIRDQSDANDETTSENDSIENDSDSTRNLSNTELVLTDLYPDKQTAAQFDDPAGEKFVTYSSQSIDAASVPDLAGQDRAAIRTMICSFHHMKPETAQSILQDVQQQQQPMLIFEMSDNTVPPIWLWWLTLLPNFLFGLCVAAFTRPMTWRRFLFSFLLPIIPACFAWDGAVSNVRTYNEADFRELLEPIQDEDYHWEVQVIPGTMVNHLLIRGTPSSKSQAQA